jgi:aspartyl-tRNA(Asn)/glutamyl-tRNA(Gln) amidotransferase subunit B
MQLEAIIGLEIHVQLKTKTKMFCACANIFGNVEPNSAICPICLGYPGTLPVPNKQAIEWTQLAGAALGCKLSRESKFDRKSYFYPDLPKGYQISQYDKPFCGSGKVNLMIGEKDVAIGITRVHLEEDAAKNIHPTGAAYTLIDYNRAGTPLIEIVTEPDFRSPAQAKVFLQELQRNMRALGISDADMEKGQLRCDANISLRERGSDQLNLKTEIKNLNSFRNVERALAFEIKRQEKEFGRGHVPETGATRGFDAAKGVTTQQRSKEEAADYRYFPEPDIPPFTFTTEELRQREVDLPELPSVKRERLIRQLGISSQHAQLLADLPPLANFFENTASEIEQLDQEQTNISPDDIPALVRRAANVILGELRRVSAKTKDGAAPSNITPANFAELIVLLHQEKMNKNATPRVLAEMEKTGGDPDHILENLGLAQISSAADLTQVIEQVIAENQDVVAKIRAGKDAALKTLVGQVMQKTSGRANPKLAAELLRQKMLDHE